MKNLLKQNSLLAVVFTGVLGFVFGIVLHVALELLWYVLSDNPPPLSEELTLYLTVGVLWLVAFLIMFPLVGYLQRKTESERTRNRLEYLRYFFMFLVILAMAREKMLSGQIETSDVVGTLMGALVATLIFTPLSRHLDGVKRIRHRADDVDASL